MYLDDFVAGTQYQAGPITVDKDELIAFAKRYDPQPFHTDPEAAKTTLFGGLAASGWMTGSLTMRMLIESGNIPTGGLIAREVEKIEWPRPTRAGDTLRAMSEVIETIPSKTKPDRGMLRMRTTTTNQNGEIVQIMTALLVVPRRVAPDETSKAEVSKADA
ncbi:MAG TPA: MaoC family dehydratase [Magnetospirillaceae bacterium]|jgi:acyl dehydratase